MAISTLAAISLIDASGRRVRNIAIGSLKKEQMLFRDAEAPLYERSFSEYSWTAEEQAVRAYLKQSSQGRILDAGGGIGVYTSKALSRGAEVVVVDFSIRALELNRLRNSRYRTTLDLILADVGNLPFRDESFQGCLLLSILQCMENDSDVISVLLEARRILRPQGSLCLTVYNHRLLSRLRGDHTGWHRAAYPRLKYRRFTYGELRKILLPNFLIIGIRGYENFAYLERLWGIAIRLLGHFVVSLDATLNQILPLSFLMSENLLAVVKPRFQRRVGQTIAS